MRGSLLVLIDRPLKVTTSHQDFARLQVTDKLWESVIDLYC
jgi:hypothetical protein